MLEKWQMHPMFETYFVQGVKKSISGNFPKNNFVLRAAP